MDYAQSLIDDFSSPTKAPHIAISVDMLDTGIDVPQVLNLVFFKLLRSKTKFWQMIGRGTRLCPDVFGPGQDKEFFYVFDFCQNLEFFSQDVPRVEGNTSESLSARLFRARLDAIGSLDSRHKAGHPQGGDTALRADFAAHLQSEVAAMTLDNFLVRPHRRLVERFSKAALWETLDDQAREMLSTNLAGLPTTIEPEKVEAKQFDLLMLNIQLCMLGARTGVDRHGIGTLLEG